MRDLDSFGHVNNAVYLTYIEDARVAYFLDVIGIRDIAEINNVIASVGIEFKSQLDFPGRVRTGASIERVGNKSFEFRYRIEDGEGTLVAEASSVQVMFDVEAGETIPVPHSWRRRIEEFEGRDTSGQEEPR